jgi:hypothetical protein
MNGVKEHGASRATTNVSIVLRKAYLLESAGIVQSVTFGDVLLPDYSTICNHIQETRALTQSNTASMLNTIQKLLV